MPNINWRLAIWLNSTQGGDWRNQLPAGSRHKMIYKILELLRRYHPFSGLKGIVDLRRTALLFEESMFNAAISQEDYSRMISVSMQDFKTKYQNHNATTAEAMPTDVEGTDWRAGLHPEARQRIVNKILETIMRHSLPGQEVIPPALRDFAGRFEAHVYNSATGQRDYLEKIYSKMQHYEIKDRNHNATNSPLFREFLGVLNNDIQSTAAADMAGSNWRIELTPESRQRLLNKMLETLKCHLPFSRQEGMPELRNIAARFEAHVYNVATTKVDYVRKISLKMQHVEGKFANPMANSILSNGASSSSNPIYPGYAPVYRGPAPHFMGNFQ